MPQSQSPTTTVKIAATQILPGAAPTLSVGDLLHLTVRANPKDSIGLVYLRGQLIQAALPGNVVPGDRLTARLEKHGDQILFRILEINPTLEGEGELDYPKPKAPVTVTSTREELSSAFGMLIAKVAASLPQDAQQFLLPQSMSIAASPKNLLLQANQTAIPAGATLAAELAQTLLDIATLPDGAAVAIALRAVAEGSVSVSLRAIAEQIRSTLPQDAILATPAERMGDALRQELLVLLGKAAADPTEAVRVLDRLLTGLQDELRPDRKVLTSAAKEMLQNVQAELKKAKESPDELLLRVHSATALVTTKSTGTKSDALKGSGELLQLAGRLDALAATYDAMNQLNTVRHAFGEPAMILFPFLLQGMITHTELLVDPDAGKHSQGKKKGSKKDLDSDGDGSDKGGSDTTPFQRVHITVPLPTLGLVSVEVAHRNSEVMTRVTVESAEIATFLTEHIAELARALQAANLSLLDFSTGVGIDQSQLLERRISSDAHTDFIA